MSSDSPRSTRSQRGRPAIDWDAAFTFWAGLPADRRSYAEVAKHFGVSVRTVERHGREQHWQERLRSINEQARELSAHSIAEARAKQAEKTVRLIEATLIAYAEKLRRGEVRIVPADLDRLYRLALDLGSETEPASPLAASASPTPAPRSDEHLRDVLDALAESDALQAVGLRLND